MGVHNVHERLLATSEQAVGALIDTLAGDDDQLWPGAHWPAMRFDRPLGVGADGGHGPVRYWVVQHVPGTWIRFAFAAPRGFHEYAVLPAGEGPGGRQCLLRHTLTMNARGSARVTWPLLWGPLHDACLEDSMDRAELACTSRLPHPARWSPYVRLLRSLAVRIGIAPRPDVQGGARAEQPPQSH